MTLDGGITYPLIIFCDYPGCDTGYATDTYHVERAMCAAELDGWTINDNTEHALCPEHQ